MFARLRDSWPFLLFYGGLAVMFGVIGFVIYDAVNPQPPTWIPLIVEIIGVVMFIIGWAEITARADEQ